MGLLDTQGHCYTTDSGHNLPIVNIPAMTIAAIQSNIAGQPKPPVVEVSLAGNKTTMENTDDPEYTERIEEWRAAQKINTMISLIALGTSYQAPKEWLEEHGDIFPNTSPNRMRVYYILSLMSNDESNDFVEAIMSQSLPTEKGLAAAGARFQSADQRD